MSIGGWIKKLITKVFGDLDRPRHDNLVSTQKFQQLDPEVMRKRLELVRKGKENGENNLPESNSTGLDAVETEIIAAINSEKDFSLDQYLHARSVMTDRANSYRFSTRLSEIGAASDSAIANFRMATHNGSNFLFQEKRKLLLMHNAMKKFKEKHGLDRPSFHPESKIFRYAILSVLFLIESGVNATFLAEGDNLYLIGGLGKALAIAFINIIVSFLIGWNVTRWIMHRSWFGKLVGYVVTTLWIGGILFFNLLVAHFRYASGLPDVENAAVVAMNNMRADLFMLPDFVSWVLFLMGFFFAVISLFDGFTMDDQYPGYGPMSRELDKVERDYAEEKAVLLEELEHIKSVAELKMTGNAGDITAWQGGYRNIMTRAESLRKAFNSHLDQIEDIARNLLQTYRDENVKYRKSPAPAHFNVSWNMERPNIQFDDRATEEIANQNEPALTGVESEIRRRREAMLNAYMEALTEYRRIDEMVSSGVEMRANESV